MEHTLTCDLCDHKWSSGAMSGLSLQTKESFEKTSLPVVVCTECGTWLQAHWDWILRTLPASIPGHREEVIRELRNAIHNDRRPGPILVKKEGVTFSNPPLNHREDDG